MIFLIVSRIILGRIEGIIDPPTTEYFNRVCDYAEKVRAELILFTMDTPGGLDKSMREIVKRELGSKIPICIYVYPDGARCASAGVFILLAAHYAAMCPGTNMGSAHPVAIGGKVPKEMKEKIVNDAAAYIKAIAEKRGRNEEWAEKAVRKSVNVTAHKALELNLIDFVADSVQELIEKISQKIEIRDKNIEEVKWLFKERFLHTITNPNIAYLLLVLGLYALIFELMHPGAIFPGVFGAVSLLLGLYGLHILPVNYAGIGLIILGIVLFILEALTPTFGPLTIGGITCLIFGSMMLIRVNVPFLKISRSLILTVAILLGGFFSFALTMALRAMRRRPVTGKEGLIGLVGECKQPIKPGKEGVVMVQGTLWRAIADESIKRGERVEVIETLPGLILKVKKTKRIA